MSGGRRQADRGVLAAGREYLAAGWPIVLLSPAADYVVCGTSPQTVDTAMEWWSSRPYGIACLLGSLFDVIELPPDLGERVLGVLRHNPRGPASVIEVPMKNRWLMLVTPGSPVMQEFAAYRQDARLLQSGWVPLPPTPVVGGQVMWVSRGGFPHSLVAQTTVVHVLRTHEGSTADPSLPRDEATEPISPACR